MSRPTVGSEVRIRGTGRHGQITIDHGDSDEFPYKVLFSDGGFPPADWFGAGQLEYNAVQAPSAACATPGPVRPSLGSKVQCLATGRFGEIINDDGSSLPYKVRFNDGKEPECNWFAEPSLKLAVEEAKGKQAPQNVEPEDANLAGDEHRGAGVGLPHGSQVDVAVAHDDEVAENLPETASSIVGKNCKAPVFSGFWPVNAKTIIKSVETPATNLTSLETTIEPLETPVNNLTPPETKVKVATISVSRAKVDMLAKNGSLPEPTAHSEKPTVESLTVPLVAVAKMPANNSTVQGTTLDSADAGGAEASITEVVEMPDTGSLNLGKADPNAAVFQHQEPPPTNPPATNLSAPPLEPAPEAPRAVAVPKEPAPSEPAPAPPQESTLAKEALAKAEATTAVVQDKGNQGSLLSSIPVVHEWDEQGTKPVAPEQLGAESHQQKQNLTESFEQEFSHHVRTRTPCQQLQYGALGAGLGTAAGLLAAPLAVAGLLGGAAWGYSYVKKRAHQDLTNGAAGAEAFCIDAGSSRPTPFRIRHLVRWAREQLYQLEKDSLEQRALVLDECARALAPWVQQSHVSRTRVAAANDIFAASQMSQVYDALTPAYIFLQQHVVTDVLMQVIESVSQAIQRGKVNDEQAERCRVGFPTFLEVISFIDRLDYRVHERASSLLSEYQDPFPLLPRKERQKVFGKLVDALRNVIERPGLEGIISLSSAPTTPLNKSEVEASPARLSQLRATASFDISEQTLQHRAPTPSHAAAALPTAAPSHSPLPPPPPPPPTAPAASTAPGPAPASALAPALASEPPPSPPTSPAPAPGVAPLPPPPPPPPPPTSSAALALASAAASSSLAPVAGPAVEAALAPGTSSASAIAFRPPSPSQSLGVNGSGQSLEDEGSGNIPLQCPVYSMDDDGGPDVALEDTSADLPVVSLLDNGGNSEASVMLQDASGADLLPAPSFDSTDKNHAGVRIQVLPSHGNGDANSECKAFTEQEKHCMFHTIHSDSEDENRGAPGITVADEDRAEEASQSPPAAEHFCADIATGESAAVADLAQASEDDRGDMLESTGIVAVADDKSAEAADKPSGNAAGSPAVVHDGLDEGDGDESDADSFVSAVGDSD